jgi:hypothetical protein
LHESAHALCGGRMLLMGGGGYQPETVARCWSIMLGALAGCVPAHRRAQYEALHDEPLSEDEQATVLAGEAAAAARTNWLGAHLSETNVFNRLTIAP